jgi:hypothetical protein
LREGTPIAETPSMLNRLVTSLCALGLATSATGCIIEDDGSADSTLLVVNQSSYALTEIYLTDTGSSSWGPNLIAGDILAPGEDYLLGVDCGLYDALIVAEDGVQCEQNDLDLCLNDADWVIRNNTCAVFE